MAQADLTAALIGGGRRRQRESQPVEFLRRQGHEQFGLPDGFGPRCGHGGFTDEIDANFERARLRIGGVPTRARPIPWRPETGLEGERLGMTEPAGDWNRRLLQVPPGDGQECRRARAAVEILVAAADREVGFSPLRSTGTAPAECARSQTVSAPACERVR